MCHSFILRRRTGCLVRCHLDGFCDVRCIAFFYAHLFILIIKMMIIIVFAEHVFAEIEFVKKIFFQVHTNDNMYNSCLLPYFVHCNQPVISKTSFFFATCVSIFRCYTHLVNLSQESSHFNVILYLRPFAKKKENACK